MATDWYLMNTNHDIVSGFEGEEFDNFAIDGFQEILNSSIADSVEICNYDLSQRIATKVIIQGNVQDTKLNTLQRRMLAKIGTCRSGQYVYYKNRYWLIIGLVDDNKIYEKAVIILCNYLLTWRNYFGDIIQRWVSASSASQYNNGETSTAYYFVRSDQLMVLTPDDDECLFLKHKQRFIIDRRCSAYEKNISANVMKETSMQLITYEMTRMDNVLFDYQDCGHMEFMAYQDEQHPEDGYYVVDGVGYWLCDEPSQYNNTSELTSIIDGDDEVFNGLEPAIFTAKFFDSNCEIVDIDPKWEINSDFADSLDIDYINNSICISVDNDKLINKSFELSLSAEGYNTIKKTIFIRAFI